MKRAMRVLLCVVVAGALTACARGQGFVKPGYDFGAIDRVSVVEVQGAVAGQAAKSQIADYFNIELMIRGYSPVERRDLKAVLDEQTLQHSDVTRTEDAVQIGRILNVDAVVVVSIPNYGEEMSMTAKLIDVEDGSILWVGSGSAGTGRTLGTIAGAAVGGAAGAALGGDGAGQVIGGVAGAVLGGVAGRALTPQERVLAQKVIQKVCRELPSRYAID